MAHRVVRPCYATRRMPLREPRFAAAAQKVGFSWRLLGGNGGAGAGTAHVGVLARLGQDRDELAAQLTQPSVVVKPTILHCSR
jgi:hypothetical protein